MTTLEAVTTRRATAWDPACPAKLVVVGSGDGKLDTLWSDQSGCNAHELAALIKIVQAHKDYYDFELQTAGARALSDTCRLSVQDCLDGWELEKRVSSTNEDDDEDDRDNLELLKLTLAVLHLSDIFLPLLLPHPMFSGPSSPKWGDPLQQASAITDSFHKPGAVTAPLIRFLRYHYDSPALMHPDVPDMLKAEQPELYGEDIFEGPLLFWRYVEACVLRGCLTQAWEALERHSLYQNAMALLDDIDPKLSQSAQDIVDGFYILRQVLCLAPLPGGRTDEYDDLVENDEQEIQEEWDENAQLPGLDVSPVDYKYWELENSSPAHFDLPKVYTSDAALRKHKNWQQYLGERLIPGFQLLGRIPELKRILGILTGYLDEIVFSSWAEQLCASLLYQTPALKPSQVSSLAYRFMIMVKDSDDTMGDCIDALSSEKRILLDIMQGKAGEAIDALYVLGGATGAALPSTLMAVIYTLYLDANILAPESGFRQTEFLCQAALDVLSSLAETESPDTATSLALQLLIPHMADDDNRNNHIAMCIVHILDRYFPRSDAGAREIVSLISSAILWDESESTSAVGAVKRQRQKNFNLLPLFEAIEAVFLCRYRHYMQQGSPGVAVDWLAEGIQFRSHSGSPDGACYRTLCVLCDSCTSDLLALMAGAKKDGTFGKIYNKTESIVASMRHPRSDGSVPLPRDGALVLTDVREVQVLLCVEELVDAYVISKDYESAAKQIIACIDLAEDSGTRSTGKSLPYSLYWHFLVIAKEILLEDESRGFLSDPESEIISSFNQKGIKSLLAALQQVTKLSDGSKTPWGPPNDNALHKMQGLLGRAFARACVVENAEKKRHPHARTMDEKIASTRSKDLALQQPNMQQAVVLHLLEF